MTCVLRVRRDTPSPYGVPPVAQGNFAAQPRKTSSTTFSVRENFGKNLGGGRSLAGRSEVCIGLGGARRDRSVSLAAVDGLVEKPTLNVGVGRGGMNPLLASASQPSAARVVPRASEGAFLRSERGVGHEREQSGDRGRSQFA